MNGILQRTYPGQREHRRRAMSLARGNKRLAQAFNASTLKKDDFESILAGFIEIARKDQLSGASDLRDRGLILPESIEHTIVTKESVDEFEPARRSINPTKRDNNDTVFTINQVPVPIIDISFGIPFRMKGFDYKQAEGMSAAQYQVLLSLDDLIFNGDTSIVLNIDGVLRTIYGYTTQPNRATETISDWSAATTNVLANTLTMTAAMVNSNEIPPVAGSMIMYLPFDWWTPLKGQAFAAKGSNNFLKQILEDNPEISKIQPTDRLTDEVLLVVMRADKVQLVEAQAPVVIPDVIEGALSSTDFTAWTAAVPFLHQDANNRTGIVHGSL